MLKVFAGAEQHARGPEPQALRHRPQGREGERTRREVRVPLLTWPPQLTSERLVPRTGKWDVNGRTLLEITTRVRRSCSIQR